MAGLREELAKLVRDGVSPAELKDAVSAMLTQRQQSRASDDAVAGALARNLYLGRTMAWSAEFDARLQALTVDQVNAAIRRRFKPETLSVYAAGDFAQAARAKADTPEPRSK